MRQPNTLRGVRENLLGFAAPFTARALGIPLDRLCAIEDGAEPTVLEIELMSELYGVDAGILASEPIALIPGDGVTVLTSLEEFREVGDVVRQRIVRAANAARDLVRLAEFEGRNRRDEFTREAPAIKPRTDVERPYKEGREVASELRKQLGLRGPIESMRDLVAERFPSLTVLHADLGSTGPAGLSLVDHLRGPAIVLNTRGKNENPLVRRFSLAHELGHLLVDWNRHQPLATVSGYFTESALHQERRANAFAVRFLCPEGALKNARDDLKQLAAYGLPFAALRLYLRNEAGTELPKEIPPGLGDHWVDRERPLGLSDFPLEDVPTERRTLVAESAARLYSSGTIVRDELAEFLRVPPTSELERVLDYFAVDAPADAVADLG